MKGPSVNTPTSIHTLLLCPDHLILLLRDIDCDAGVGADTAITQAQQHIAASSGYGIYVEAAQNLITLRITVEAWTAAPTRNPGTGWSEPIAVELDCPTGQLQAGDDMGNVVDGITAPHGPGRYHVAVHHRGRETAVAHERQLHAAMTAGITGDRLDALRAEREGTEEYLFRLWWHSPLPDDDDDEPAAT